MTTSGDYQLFEAGDVTLQSGVVFPSMRLAYKTYGRLNAGKDNVIVYPTSFSAQHFDTEWLIQPGGILDPDRFFIVIPNLFGNGLSSSPSNSDVTPFPDISYHDAVAVQRRLLVEQFGISGIALVYGWSMGGMQAYHWAACHPDMVERAAVVCGSAKCSPYNHVFLEGVKAALTDGPRLQGRPFRRQTRRRLARHGARLCRMGDVARVLPRRGLARGGLQLAGRLSGPRLGCQPSHGATPMICSPRSASGSAATSARAPRSAATWTARSLRSRQGSC